MECFKEVSAVKFPEFTAASINMMPIIMGDRSSIPEEYRQYASMIDACNFDKGDTVYLSITESTVIAGVPQRRGGIHTEAFKNVRWGCMGGWGCNRGLYMASTTGDCRVWPTQVSDVGHLGALEAPPVCAPVDLEGDKLYWLTDRVPHEALPAAIGGKRQWFRLVSSHLSVWYSQHNTANRLGVQPKCPVSHMNKFAA